MNKVSAKWSSTPSTNDPRQLNIWIRADSWGSIEALENYLYQIVIPNDEYYFQIISKDVGPLYEHIIKECDSRNCFILNFNVPIKRGRFRERHVSIFDSNIIFDLFNKLIETLEDKLAPIEQHVLCGRAWVKEVFEVKGGSGGGSGSAGGGGGAATSKVAGCIVETGKIKYDGHFRVKRNGKILYEQWGVTELKHFAVNAEEIESGDECGLKLDFDEWEPEDLIECLEITQQKNKISPPIFDLDPALQQSLYGGDGRGEGGGGGGGAGQMEEGGTVFSYAEDGEYRPTQFVEQRADSRDDHEFVGQHGKSTSDAPRVKATKKKRGGYVFENAEAK